MDVFHAPGKNVIKRLAEADGKRLETVGILVFLNLGIAITGFLQDAEQGQMSISVSAKVRWDSEIEALKPFKMKRIEADDPASWLRTSRVRFDD